MSTHFQGSETTRTALDAFIKLTRASNALEHHLYHAGDVTGLTVTQFGVLETLYHLGPLCQGELSAKQLKSSGNMTLVLDNLEKMDLVRRIRQDADRRKILIDLTKNGRALIEEVFPRMADAITRALSGLTAEEQIKLGSLAKKLGRSLGESEKEAV